MAFPSPPNQVDRRVTGPRTLTLRLVDPDAQDEEQKAYLVFDATFTHYVGIDFNGGTNVEGFRRLALDPARVPPVEENK